MCRQRQRGRQLFRLSFVYCFDRPHRIAPANLFYTSPPELPCNNLFAFRRVIKFDIFCATFSASHKRDTKAHCADNWSEYRCGQRLPNLCSLAGRGVNWPIDPVKPVKNRSTKFDKSKTKLEFRRDSRIRMISSLSLFAHCYTLCRG